MSIMSLLVGAVRGRLQIEGKPCNILKSLKKKDKIRKLKRTKHCESVMKRKSRKSKILRISLKPVCHSIN